MSITEVRDDMLMTKKKKKKKKKSRQRRLTKRNLNATSLVIVSEFTEDLVPSLAG